MAAPEDDIKTFHEKIILAITNDLINNNKKVICHCRGGIGFLFLFV